MGQNAACRAHVIDNTDLLAILVDVQEEMGTEKRKRGKEERGRGKEKGKREKTEKKVGCTCLA
jgi:hypothetical protein